MTAGSTQSLVCVTGFSLWQEEEMGGPLISVDWLRQRMLVYPCTNLATGDKHTCGRITN